MTAPVLGVTAPYMAVLGLMFLALSVRVLLYRRRHNVGFGDGGDEELRRRVRVQANFAEYVPLALLLLTVAELRGAGAVWLHLLCVTLVIGRALHAVGLSRASTDMFGRVGGMTGSMTAILGAAVLILIG